MSKNQLIHASHISLRADNFLHHMFAHPDIHSGTLLSVCPERAQFKSPGSARHCVAGASATLGDVSPCSSSLKGIRRNQIQSPLKAALYPWFHFPTQHDYFWLHCHKAAEHSPRWSEVGTNRCPPQSAFLAQPFQGIDFSNIRDPGWRPQKSAD